MRNDDKKQRGQVSNYVPQHLQLTPALGWVFDNLASIKRIPESKEPASRQKIRLKVSLLSKPNEKKTVVVSPESLESLLQIARTKLSKKKLKSIYNKEKIEIVDVSTLNSLKNEDILYFSDNPNHWISPPNNTSSKEEAIQDDPETTITPTSKPNILRNAQQDEKTKGKDVADVVCSKHSRGEDIATRSNILSSAPSPPVQTSSSPLHEDFRITDAASDSDAVQVARAEHEERLSSKWMLVSPHRPIQNPKDATVKKDSSLDIEYSRHCVDRMKARDIIRREIEEAISRGDFTVLKKKRAMYRRDGICCIVSTENGTAITAWREGHRVGRDVDAVRYARHGLTASQVRNIKGTEASMLKAIERKTGVSLSVLDDEGSVFIAGEEECVETAKYFVDNLVDGNLKGCVGIEKIEISIEKGMVSFIQDLLTPQDISMMKRHFNIISCQVAPLSHTITISGEEEPCCIAERHIESLLSGTGGIFPHTYVSCKSAVTQLASCIKSMKKRFKLYEEVLWYPKYHAYKIVCFDPHNLRCAERFLKKALDEVIRSKLIW